MSEKKKRSFLGLNRVIGLSFIVQFNRSLGRSFKQLIKPQNNTAEESFEQACARLELTEEDIAKRTKEFFNIFILFAIFALLVFAYSIYLFWGHHFRGGIIGIAATAIVLTQVFRYHFWYFQMKKRKLNCSIKDWLKS